MFSLCICTKDRSKYLIPNLKRYLVMDLVEEIIICDENGNDIKKIKEYFGSELPKLRLFINDKPLGAFLNKISCCQKASNTWIALIDSAKIADVDYFEFVKNCIEQNDYGRHTMIAPYYGNDKKTFTNDCIITQKNFRFVNIGKSRTTGNYVLHKTIIDDLVLNEQDQSFNPLCYDVMYFLIIIFEQFSDLTIHMCKDLKYKHVVTSDSLTLKMCKKYPAEIKKIKDYLNNRMNEIDNN